MTGVAGRNAPLRKPLSIGHVQVDPLDDSPLISRNSARGGKVVIERDGVRPGASADIFHRSHPAIKQSGKKQIGHGLALSLRQQLFQALPIYRIAVGADVLARRHHPRTVRRRLNLR